MTIYHIYIKTHNITGLKYLGRTTDIIFSTNNKKELKEKGLYYSDLWDIVESEDWANLTKEKGDGVIHTEKTRKNLSIKLSGENNPRYGKKHSKETKQKMSEVHYDCSGTNNPMFGHNHSDITKDKISKINLGRKHTEESSQKKRQAMLKIWEQRHKSKESINKQEIELTI